MVLTEESDDISSLSALCLGCTYVGTCNAEICKIILADLMERDPSTLNNPSFLLNVLGLGYSKFVVSCQRFFSQLLKFGSQATTIQSERETNVFHSL